MILQSLYRYYNVLIQDTESSVAPPGYNSVGVSYALDISKGGELRNVIPLFMQIKQGNQLVEKPRRMNVPEHFKRSSGIKPNFLCDNNVYVLGLSDKAAKDPSYSVKRFEAFRLFNKKLLADADCDAARAVIAFLDNFDQRLGGEHPEILRARDGLLKGGNLVFYFQDKNVHEDPEIRRTWDKYKTGTQAVKGQCLVTGEINPISILHASIKGVKGKGAPSSGATLVGFNARAYESYNRVKGQGLNSPVSEKATFAYTTALNFLLSSANPNRKFYIGDTTVVYWAESGKKEYASAFASLFEPEYGDKQPADQDGRKKAEGRMKEVAGKVRRAQALDVSKITEGLDKETLFYVLGLAPNVARIAVRFFLTDSFGKMVERIMRHYDDLKIVKEFDNQPTYITVGQMLNETVSKKSRDKDASPLMAGAVMRAIFTGGLYPQALYYAIINRTRADKDDKVVKKINYVRAAVIKAFLIRKYHNQPKYQEVLAMSLNEQATTPAYVLGRLFAVLEKAQQEAIVDVNAGIKDRYFTSACASPASVFPVLMRLSQHHISRAEFGYSLDRRIQDVLALLDVEKNPIPARLSLDEQGVFILGYYHQRAAFYVKKNASDEPALSEIK